MLILVNKTYIHTYSASCEIRLSTEETVKDIYIIMLHYEISESNKKDGDHRHTNDVKRM